jgi:hypothetical protein
MEGVGGVWKIGYWRVCTAVRKRKRGRKVWAKNAKPSGSGPISGMPCQMEVDRSRRQQWCSLYNVTVVVGQLVQKRERGRGVWDKNVKLGGSGSISGTLGQTEVDGGRMRWWGGSYDVTAVTRRRVRKRNEGKGVGGRKLKTEHNGSISGIPCQTAVEGGEMWWWAGLYDVMAVVRCCVHKLEEMQWVGGQKPETEHNGSVSGCIWLHMVGWGAVGLL